MRDDLTWRFLVGLHQVYKTGRTTNKLLKNKYIKHIVFENKQLIGYKNSNLNVLVSRGKRFDEFFEKELLNIYNYYTDFFNNAGLEMSGRKNYPEDVLRALILIFKNKEELRENLSTAHIFSSEFFEEKDSKFLDNQPGLKKDILKILEVDEFPFDSPKSQQWRLVVDCKTPEYILLCENLDFLKVPFRFRENNIELWYLGGNNTKKLNEISQTKLIHPIYYVCDWDYHGLKFYTDIKKILKLKNKAIELIVPIKPMLKPSKSGKHKSEWQSKEFSGLLRNEFTDAQAELIQELILKDKWIEEQTIDPITSMGIEKK